jgi:hypothetical protein
MGEPKAARKRGLDQAARGTRQQNLCRSRFPTGEFRSQGQRGRGTVTAGEGAEQALAVDVGVGDRLPGEQPQIGVRRSLTPEPMIGGTVEAIGTTIQRCQRLGFRRDRFESIGRSAPRRPREIKLRGATELHPMLLNVASRNRTCHDHMSLRPRTNQTLRENAGALRPETGYL